MSPAQAGSRMFLVTKQIHENVLRRGVQGSVEQIYNTEVSQFLPDKGSGVLTPSDFHYKAAVNILLWIGLGKKKKKD